MLHDQFDHLIRAAGAILGEAEIVVIGSQALLASVARDAQLPPEAMRSIEVDVLPVSDPEGTKADMISAAMGELSMFHTTHAIYAEGVSRTTARLPQGWWNRLVAYSNANTGGVTALCLEAHDLVVSKLLASRPKDYEFVNAVVVAGVVDPSIAAERLETTDATTAERARALAALEHAAEDPLT